LQAQVFDFFSTLKNYFNNKMNQVKELDEIEDEEAIGKAFVLKTDPVTKSKSAPILST
jgi:hypothetical protein